MGATGIPAAPKAPENFTERTLSEVRQIDAKGGQFETAFVRTAQRLIRASLWVAASLLTFGLGFALTQWAWPNPTTRLVRDLSIAEHLNEYLDVGDFEFLKELADSPDFGTEPD